VHFSSSSSPVDLFLTHICQAKILHASISKPLRRFAKFLKGKDNMPHQINTAIIIIMIKYIKEKKVTQALV
jgi:hypothetical protein